MQSWARLDTTNRHRSGILSRNSASPEQYLIDRVALSEVSRRRAAAHLTAVGPHDDSAPRRSVDLMEEEFEVGFLLVALSLAVHSNVYARIEVIREVVGLLRERSAANINDVEALTLLVGWMEATSQLPPPLYRCEGRA